MAESTVEVKFEQDDLVDLPAEKQRSRVSLDLDEILGFTAARQKADIIVVVDEVEPDFLPYRIFFSNVDSFHGKHITDFISDQILGATISKGVEEGADEDGDREEEEEREDEEREEEEFSEEEHETRKKKKKDKEPKKPVLKHLYQFIGTAQDPCYTVTESIREIIKTEDRAVYLSQIMKCGFAIFDITRDPNQITEAMWTLNAIVAELDQMQRERPKAFKKMQEIRHFILISTVLTWALTKPIDPEEPDLAFTEADYRKRKPHPNYKQHIELEKEVVMAGKKHPTKFKTLVVCCGVTYGSEEDVLHFLFKMAWHNTPQMPIFQPGTNIIPLLHVQDLVTVINLLLDRFPSPKMNYILAVEQTPSTLRDTIRAISKELSTGMTRKVPKEEAFLLPEMTQELFDILTANINMEPTYIVEDLNITWKSEMNFVENIHQIVAEYKEARGLKPLRIFVHGPPASGKTTIAKKLCEHYQLEYLGIKEVIENTIQDLKDKTERVKDKEKEHGEEEEVPEEEEEEDEEEDENMQESLEEVYALLEEVESNIAENGGRLDESYVLKFFKDRMMSHQAQNQGYVLDGFPKTLQQAKVLFEALDEDEAEEEEDVGAPSNKIMPEFILSLEASDEVLCERVMAMPEQDIQGTHYTEEGMLRRLTEFRTINADENTTLNFFDELEVHPILVNMAEEKSSLMSDTMECVIAKIGKPRNYGLTPQEHDVIALLEEEIQRVVEENEHERKQEIEKRLHKERLSKMQEWASLMDALREEEEEILSVQSMPLRHYLIKYIFPTVTRGLIEVAQIRPSDPVDYLAEYLFKENPEGKMFQPECTKATEKLFDAIQKFQDSLTKMEVISNDDQELLAEKTVE